MAGFSISTFALLKKMIADSLKGAGAIKGQKGDKGDAGTIAINSVKTLPTGSEATVENVGTASSAKLNIGIPEGQQGKTGPKGSTGATGQSAYEAAKANGYTGTVTEWLESLHGKDGAAGKAGEDGEAGPAGKSAYEIAKEQGYTGTEAEWIGSLKGKQGDKGETGKDGADGKSFTIQAQYATEAELKAAHPTGNAGDAYYVGENTASSRPDVYIWLAESNEWYNQGPISGVKGDDGASGKSAYELAEENGYSGSESEWLASLKGAKGDKGEKGDQGPQGEQGIQGLQGPQGIAGAKGDKGDTGATGEKGDKGEKGDAATIKVGKVVSGEAGTEAVVANSGTTSDAVFDFTIPRGDKGDKGDTGDNGVIRTTDYNLKDSVAGDIAIRNWTKNLVRYPYSNQGDTNVWTDGGITFTLNPGTKELTATGTATANAEFGYFVKGEPDYYILKKGTYTLSGCPAGGSATTYSFHLYSDTDYSFYDYGEGVTFTLKEDTKVTLAAMVVKGTTVDGLVFGAPMLESGTVKHKYVPYEGYDIKTCGKNLLPNISDWPTNNNGYGVTFTVGEDGWVTPSGTFTGLDHKAFGFMYTSKKNATNTLLSPGNYKAIMFSTDPTKMFIQVDSWKDYKYYKTVMPPATGTGAVTSKPFTIEKGTDYGYTIRLTINVNYGDGNTIPDGVKFAGMIIRDGDSEEYEVPHREIISVANDTTVPVYGLKSFDGVTNILTDYGAEVEVDYPKTVNGQYALSSAKTASDNATAIAANAIKSVEIKGTTNDWGVLNIQELLSFPTTRIINVATTSADYITTMATSSAVRVISVSAPDSPAAVANTEVTLKIIYV